FKFDPPSSTDFHFTLISSNSSTTAFAATTSIEIAAETEPTPPFAVAVIVAVPMDLPVITPEESTTATASLSDCQETEVSVASLGWYLGFIVIVSLIVTWADAGIDIASTA